MSDGDRLEFGVPFFAALAQEMNDHPSRFAELGDADMTVELSLGGRRVRLEFAGLACVGVACVGVACVGVAPPDADATPPADFELVGDLDAWRTMFAEICASGRAEGRWTINSLVLLGDAIRLEGGDPMGLDRFSRFNQTLQEYFDGAARIGAAEVVG